MPQTPQPQNTPTIDYDALAKQAGAVDTDSPQSQPQANPNVDYDALAKQAGAVEVPQDETPEESGITRNADGSWVITPKEGESFADTMKRAAAMGNKVTPEMIQSQTKKGLREAPVVLAAAPVAGAAGAGSLAGIGETIFGSPVAFKAVAEMAKAHPEAARHIARVLVGTALGGDAGHSAKSALLGGLLAALLK